MIALTNHALDHMLSSVLKAGITTSIVRLGSRSADEQISQLSLDNLEKASERNPMFSALIGKEYGKLKDIERRLKELLSAMLKQSSSEISRYISMAYPAQYASVLAPPRWIHSIWTEEKNQVETRFKTAGYGKNRRQPEDSDANDTSLLGFWRHSRDLDFLKLHKPGNVADRAQAGAPEPSSPLDVGDRISPDDQHELSATDALDFFARHEIDQRPEVPTTDRPIHVLRDFEGDVWQLSTLERAKLLQFWIEEARQSGSEAQMEDYKDLRTAYIEAISRKNAVSEEVSQPMYRLFIYEM